MTQSSFRRSTSGPQGKRRSHTTALKVFGLAIVALLMVTTYLAPHSIAQDETPTPPAAPSVMDAALPGGTLPGNPQIQLVQVATGLVDPINLTNAGDGSGRLFVVERTGTIRIIKDGQVLPDPFLDIGNEVKTDFLEQGLLGLAFHPDYENNGRFFVYFSSYIANGAVTLQEYAVSADNPDVADPESARTLFSFADPYVNHNGGTIKFGADGYLYISIGDGGLAGDPWDNAQDLSNIFGKILRIDVDSGDPYGIPADNPFADSGRPLYGAEFEEPGRYHPDAAREIWSYGLRNPWQFAFDRETGDLYVADVGQNYWEEVNFAESGTSGQNWGWDHLEGTHCYPADVTECLPFGVAPVAEYDHSTGSCSITGIGVYRGSVSTALTGIYFNSDFCSGNVWGLMRDDSGAWQYQELLDTSLLITGAGEGEDGELYATSCNCQFSRDYDPFADPQGAVWQIVAADQVAGDAVIAPVGTEEAATPVAGGEEATPADGAGGGDMATTQDVTLVDIAFQPAELTIPANTDVTINLTNQGALPHSFDIDELGVNSGDIAAGQSGTVTINAAPGTYEYYCAVPGHKEAGMVGTLTVQ
jgi:glucose/arabinose dehydrogenase/plastocyanin